MTQLTVNEMCSSSRMTSSSCRPTRSGSGHDLSSSLQEDGEVSYVIETRFNRAGYFVTSLSRMMRLTSSTTSGDTVTFPKISHSNRSLDDSHSKRSNLLSQSPPTFFTDHGVLLVVGVVGVAQLAVGLELELHELVAELAAVANTNTTRRVRGIHEQSVSRSHAPEVGSGMMYT